MGWVTDELADKPNEVFYEVACNFTANDVKRKLTDYGGENASPCEFFSDYLRDYYKVSINTLTEILTLLKGFYGDKLPYFYYTEKK